VKTAAAEAADAAHATAADAAVVVVEPLLFRGVFRQLYARLCGQQIVE
jgi:hypothetical protein